MKAPAFKDHFSKQADLYVKYRPGYPEALFAFLGALTQNHDLALDCATGNGQAAMSLASYFKKVVAVDASEAQLKRAVQNPKIEYVLASAEDISLEKQSVDLISAASGIHWFDLDRFYNQVRRLLRPNGIIAVWAYYGWTSNSGLHQLVYDFEQRIVGDYWPSPFQKDMKLFYLSLPFPFDEIATPDFELPIMVDREWVSGYLKTWSATQRYMDANQRDPTELIKNEMESIFNKTGPLVDLSFKPVLRVGRFKL